MCSDLVSDLRLTDFSGTLVEPAELEPYRRDWSGEVGGVPLAVMRPDSVAALSAIVALAHEHALPITVQGGLTGLAGGAVPDPDDLVISLERLDAIEEFDEIGGTLTVQGGVTLARIAEIVEARGWYFPLDIGARGSCRIGGNVATNAGGNRVLRYGPTRDLVLGLEAVLADGTVLPMMNRVLKNNTGPDLKQLFIGSEGSFGIVARVVLRLFPLPQTRRSALCGVASFEQVALLLKHARGDLPGLSSFEVMWKDYLDAAAGAIGASVPFGGAYPIYVLIEAEGSQAPAMQELFESFLEARIEDGTAADIIVAQTNEQARSLWAFRDAIGELFRQLAPYVTFDVGIPLRATGDYIARARARLEAEWPDVTHLFFGHLGDGNLHIVTGPHPDPAQRHKVDTIIYELVRDIGGSISAEHGIGRIKKPFLSMSRNAEEIALLHTLKASLDPRHALNANRIL